MEANLYDEEFDRQDGYILWLKLIKKYKILNLNKPYGFIGSIATAHQIQQSY